MTTPQLRRALRGWLTWDVFATLAFVTIGRHAHGHVDDLRGVLATWWPFGAGVAVGWLLVRSRGHTLWPGGVVVWLSTLTVGMALRLVAHQGVVWLFVFVAGAFLALFLVAPRLAARLLGGAGRGPRGRSPIATSE